MSVSIQLANKSDLEAISQFIQTVYDQAIAQTYSEQGNQEFYTYIELDAITKRFGVDHWILKAIDGEDLVGIIEIRKNQHLSMLFVKTRRQNQGIGRQLLSEAIKRIKKLNPNQKSLSVHSTPNAVAAYEKLGFRSISKEQIINGIIFVTMEKSLS